MKRLRFLMMLVVFVIALALQLFPAQAFSVSGWTRYYEGVEYATGTATSPRLMRAFAVRISLRNPDVSMYASHDNGGSPYEVALETTPNFLYYHTLKAAINTCYFDPNLSPNTNIEGLLVSNGGVVSLCQYMRESELRFTSANVGSIAVDGGTSGVYNCGSGCEYALVNGVCMGDNGAANPRTSGGLSQDGRYAIFVVVDGRQPGWSDGATILDMAFWQQSFGAYNAICFDGGGSSTMTISGLGSYVNRPCYGYARSVGASLGVASSYPKTHGPAVCATATRADIFTRGYLNRINQRTWTSGGGWGSLVQLAGSTMNTPGVCSRAAGQFDLVYINLSNHLIYTHYNGTTWDVTTDLGGGVAADNNAATICARDATHLDVFIRGADNAIWQNSWSSSQGWYQNVYLGGTCWSGPAVCSRDANHMDVFVQASNILWSKTWTNGSGWTADWANLGGGIKGSPAVCSRSATNMEVFVLGNDNAIWQNTWSSAQGWYYNASLGGVCASEPGACKADANTLQVYVRGTDDRLAEKWWTSAAGWSIWTDVGAYY